MFVALFLVLLTAVSTTRALRWQAEHVGYNLNENQTAVHPRDYWGQWENHTHHPSPKSWRFPFYMLTLDRYLDGDPSNNEANGTVFEHHWLTNQFRYGGDTMGLLNDLDYIQGMGIKALYLVGSPFLNRPWSGDGFGPLDFTLLDRHHGSIEDWRTLIAEIHRRDMYVIFDNTMATLGDLIAFDGFVNTSTPFSWREYDYLWKTETRYHDFQPGNARNDSCQYPRIWAQDGFPLTQDILDQIDGCRDSEFDQYGDIKSTGAYPSYINSLSKFASVQDRLREWRPDVLEKINRMSCIVISMLDIDGFRMDKALQTTVDAMAEFSSYQRDCARRHGKDNFLVVGEVVGDPNLASVYIGRGRQPDQALERGDLAVTVSNETDPKAFIRPFGMSALDSQAFNYDIYGAMTRFLGLDGPWGARGVDWVEQWNFILKHNDMVNANTGEYDPRHMFGMTNHDVFRWPALANGTQRQLLGFFITMLELPGIPMILWGEEQEFYVMENLSDDYVFGRTPIGSSSAWQLHGCYNLSQDVYVDMPFNSSGQGCHDDSVSLDHRDPAKPMRNVLKRMFELRQQYPVLNDGYNLTTLSNRTHNVYLRGSNGIPSPHGIWSVYRGRSAHVQDFTGTGQGNQAIWLLYSNENQSTTYDFDCSSPNISLALISAFPARTVVKNLFYPYEELRLEASTLKLGLDGSKEFNGCLPQLQMSAWGYKAFVPKSKWVTPRPTITKTMPSHDERLLSVVDPETPEKVEIEIRFSSEMDCESVTNSIESYSTTDGQRQPRLAKDSVICGRLKADPPRYDGEIPTVWALRAMLENVYHGVHTVTVNNASTATGNLTTGTKDRFMFRIGQTDNPMVFTKLANYSRTLLHRHTDSGKLYIAPRAAGADRMRYSRNWGTTFSPWTDYTGSNVTLQDQPWSGTKEQRWTGEHVIVHYWSHLTGSSDHVQHADLNRRHLPPRRFPHVFVQGDFNQYGYDGGLPSEMRLDDDGVWKYDLIADFPSSLIFNVWGMNPDGFPDKSHALGDVNRDWVLDWVPPESLAKNVVNITQPPPDGFLGYRLSVNDGTYRYQFSPIGSAKIQAAIATLLAVVPVLTTLCGIWIFMRMFYRVKFNRSGIREKTGHNTLFNRFKPESENLRSAVSHIFQQTPNSSTRVVLEGSQPKRRILIASLEYEIEDWNIKIKIGGLGAMASLMAKHLTHHELIWVVPCVGDIQYPQGIAANHMEATVVGKKQEISVQYHLLGPITFVLLDCPVFRKQTRIDPYPSRMDDLESATFYSMWNQCISQAIARFEPSVYHINDYHGAAAPLHLLPQVVPCCLSLHNAEFQGLWSLGTASDMHQVCSVFNLDKEIVEKYVQFGGVFNLLHAGASYLRIHQRGYGAAGVSEKYSARSKQRYPILWGLPRVTSLPNPDPEDVEGLSEAPREVIIDEVMEASRGMLRCRAQEWTGLNVDPQADLFVFVGRWSMQKGIDIVADVFFSVLQDHPTTQLICVGPVIDLYGRFAALKLQKLAEKFPGRVYSKPEFVSLPPFIFSGAEFALIPSRDEPFGLVAVEFGRKGALGVGSMVGGLGQMPGWWFTIESLTSKHLMYQLKHAIRNALASGPTLRAQLRARAMVQRFPVRQWVEDVDKLQSTAIRIHRRQQEQSLLGQAIRKSFTPSASGKTTPKDPSRIQTPIMDRSGSPVTTPPIPLPMPPHLSLDGILPERRSLDRSSQGPSPPAASLRGSVVTGSSEQNTAEQTPNEPERQGQERGSGPRERPNLNPRWTLQLLGRMSHSSFSSLFRSQDGSISERDPESSGSDAEKKKMSDLYKVDVIFTDSQNEFSLNFNRRLDKLDAKSSEGKLCIQEFLIQSEKTWFGRFHRASLGLSQDRVPTTLNTTVKKIRWMLRRKADEETPDPSFSSDGDHFRLGEDYKPPSGMRKLLQKKIGDWQIYCFLLAFGQIIAANSYQLTLLTGEYGKAALKLYVVASVYIGATLVWWYIYRRFQALYVLSAPFFIYGLAFFTLGLGLYAPGAAAQNWVFNVATGLYAAASASGSLYFALNFGTEAGTPAQTWAFRACIIQGTQQIYVAFLWYWGAMIDRTGKASGPPFSSRVVTSITVPLAVLMWVIGIVLYLGLPAYYRQRPGVVPSFYWSMIRRKSVIWFFVMVILQNYFLSTTYNRNWKFLWSSQHTPPYTIILLLLFFFILIWILLLLLLSHLSATHAWLLPIVSISLGCPRWSQTLWSTSGIALSLSLPPTLPNPLLLGALLSRSLWLWLGLLDALQGIGFGVILLQTLTRFHVAATLIMSQGLGSAVTIAARASAPHKLGPGDVFPNLGLRGVEALMRPWFWAGLGSQVLICVGFALVWRKEQLVRP